MIKKPDPKNSAATKTSPSKVFLLSLATQQAKASYRFLDSAHDACGSLGGRHGNLARVKLERAASAIQDALNALAEQGRALDADAIPSRGGMRRG